MFSFFASVDPAIGSELVTMKEAVADFR